MNAFISSTVTVEINYRLVSKDNVELWNEDKKLVYLPEYERLTKRDQLLALRVDVQRVSTILWTDHH